MTCRNSQAMTSVIEIREMMNQGRITELNSLVSGDFFSVFSLGKIGEYETYDAESYRQGNIDANEYYSGKNPRLDYTDFSSGMRGETEFIISSAIDFSLNGELKMKALVTEVYRLEQDRWKLARQYMEKYIP
jgi:hypothetical protein